MLLAMCGTNIDVLELNTRMASRYFRLNTRIWLLPDDTVITYLPAVPGHNAALLLLFVVQACVAGHVFPTEICLGHHVQ